MIFRFQQFAVAQQVEVFKVGTDAVVLGALMQITGHRVLEIGTGTGIISLMLAQRFPEAKITAIDINPAAAHLAQSNFQSSPFAERLKAFCEDANNFEAEKFDHILSNPPYFTDLQNKQSKDFIARQQACLSYQQLLQNAQRLLKAGGDFWVILPHTDAQDFETLAQQQALFLQEIHHIQGVANGPMKRAVMRFGFQKPHQSQSYELCLQSSPRVYSEAYRALTKDFHI
jgi:tRNA1Val (adenine37-N6)-methyltransferase